MAWKENAARQAQRKAVFEAVEAARTRKRTTDKHVTATEAYRQYMKANLPAPFVHFSNRRFLDYLHELAGEGILKCVTISRGDKGVALMIDVVGRLQA